MKVYVAGSGKLANAILTLATDIQFGEILKWTPELINNKHKSVVIHAGSGRQLQECIDFCRRTDSVLIELSTGLKTETMDPDFTLIVCPNTSILLLKTMSILKSSGSYFANYKITIKESHQSSKSSVPGTAYYIAEALHQPVGNIISIRDRNIQSNQLGIAEEFLDKHAFHEILIEDGSDQIMIQTKVLGHNSYTEGVRRILLMVINNSFEKKRYSVIDLIEQDML